MSLLSQLVDMVEQAVKPSLLGMAGRRIERRAKDDLAAYFRFLRKDIVDLNLGKLFTDDRSEIAVGIAKDAAAMSVNRVLRHASPVLLQALTTNIYYAMMEADKEKLILEDDAPTREPLDKVGLTGTEAANYAASHGASLITGINNTTRNQISDAVGQGILDRLGVGGLGRVIGNLMDDMTVSRANTIATTEMNDAMSEAQLLKMRRIGVEYKRVILAPDACPICQDNADDGAIPVEDLFSSGDLRTPFHPNCRCAVVGARAPEEEAA